MTTQLNPDESALLALVGKWSGMYISTADATRTALASAFESRGLVTIDRADPAQICVSLVNPPAPAPMPRLRVLTPMTPQTRPLTHDEEGLLELAEGIADEGESGGIMFLTETEAKFMDRICACDALRVPRFMDVGVAMARRLAAGRLVTIDDSAADYILVRAVRPGEEE